MCVCVSECVRACVRACARACVCGSSRGAGDVLALWGPTVTSVTGTLFPSEIFPEIHLHVAGTLSNQLTTTTGRVLQLKNPV